MTTFEKLYHNKAPYMHWGFVNTNNYIDTDMLPIGINNGYVDELIRLRDERDKAWLEYVDALRREYENEQKAKKATTIEKVVFNPPATIVFWADGAKTVVKCQDDEPFDPEKGLAMAFMKKMLGNKGNYYNTVKNLVKPYRQKEGEQS